MLKIYGQARSRAFRVIWLCNESNIPYEHVPVTINVDKAQCKEDWYLRLNPNARVPTIEDDELVMWESAAINLYLAEKYKSAFQVSDMELSRKYADPRRTEIRAAEGEFAEEDLIQDQDVVITVSRGGYVKRQPVDAFRRQGRGGRGVIGANLKLDDIISQVFTTTTHHWLLVFTNKGKVYRTKVHEVSESSRQSRGTYVANLPGMGFGGDERIAAVIDTKDYEKGKFLVFATKKGMVKKTALPEYDSPRTGLAAINLKAGDELIDVILTDGKDDLILVSRQGQAIRFGEAGVRPMGRQTGGVIGMRLRRGDEVIAMVATSQGDGLLTVTHNGFGKRTDFSEYRKSGRGGLGVKTAMLTTKVGVLAGAFAIRKDQDILVIANDGVVIRVPAVQVRKAGRATQGVRVMRLEKGRAVVAVAPVIMQAEE